MATDETIAARFAPLVRRRTLVRGLAAAVALPALAACDTSAPSSRPRMRERATCVDAATLGSYTSLGGARLVYEVDRRPAPFRIEPAFADQFAGWLAEWDAATGSSTTDLATFGTWLPDDGSCDSWHHAGRALDVTSLSDVTGTVASCRYDLWGADPASDRLGAYWALAAGLHAHFAYVLTYLYDAAHANHIHVDNGLSGADRSAFTGFSRVQNQAVQAICTHLWQVPTPVTGSWDRETRSAVRTVLGRLGVSGGLTTQQVWQDFLAGSVAHWAAGR